MSDIGASELGRWHFWQLRCRIGAMSRVNVGDFADCASAAGAAARPRAAISMPASQREGTCTP